ncbi:hypothetical protein DTW90_12085 [Neorhizobium sp. P12A]|uniref:hypothetical protein n=1 Tax=Neorhizobium sp. P12A TaxID=2268027 RepID=UPI0011ECE35A|nr:hypothetical protein [Neorhizobium sp. P12A]KAA0698539.1 hypothetical protein DTW90_12085 [Neorhizobium sp. P12A]
MTESKLPDFPEEDARGIGYHVAQTALGSADIVLPGAGYALQQIVGHLVGEPLAKRREEWFRLVGQAILDLQGTVEEFDPSSLSENEEFVSCVYEATHLAMKTHREFKRQALKNAIVNTALGFSLDETLRGRFISCIDRYSDAHIRVLSVLSNPRGYERCLTSARSMFAGSQSTVIRAEITNQEMSEEVFANVLQDLSQDRFIDGSLSGMMTGGESMLTKRTTETGDRFLKFVSNPID